MKTKVLILIGLLATSLSARSMMCELANKNFKRSRSKSLYALERDDLREYIYEIDNVIKYGEDILIECGGGEKERENFNNLRLELIESNKKLKESLRR